MIKTDWRQVLQAWMHDPVDKALSVFDHQSRAARYLSAALGEATYSRRMEERVKPADIIAAKAERIPMPTAGGGARAVSVENGSLQVFHPLSAASHTLRARMVDERSVKEVIREIVQGLPKDPQLRFLAVWRLLPDRLQERFGFDFTLLPADTRIPDHSLIHHADIASGIQAATQGKLRGYAVLSVSLGPVQTFIEAARSVRDLWSGSALLSWLIFQGIRPVVRDLGPTVMVFPALRGNPLADLWLREFPGLGKLIPEPPPKARKAPSLPNRFVALVPFGKKGRIARQFENASREAIRDGWRNLASKVRSELDPDLSKLDAHWSGNWADQVESFFEISTSVCSVSEITETDLARLVGGKESFEEVWTDAGKVRGMADVIPAEERPRFNQKGAGRWQAEMEVSARLAAAQRSIRHVPKVSANVPAGPKCSLLGTYEQVGPSNFQESAEFWAAASRNIPRIRNTERFCAVALCKRFAPERFLGDLLGLDDADLWFPDTATIAAGEWLQKTGIESSSQFNGRWIHQRRRLEDGESVPHHIWNQIQGAIQDQGSPPKYYAVLALDADDMGLWLSGARAPRVQDVVHPKLRKYFEQLDSDGLQAKRPVGPALHAAISGSLNNFASFGAPDVVERFCGTLIYSGGDDVLALLPARNAVPCAIALREAFRGQNADPQGWVEYGGRHVLAMGDRATLSAGIAFVHYKEDLRGALRAAREAEKSSKNRGKNCITLRFMRRSGERPSCRLSWAMAPWFQEVHDEFARGVSDRWIYQLRREAPALSDPQLPSAAVDAAIGRLIWRSQAATVSGISANTESMDHRWHQYRRYPQSSENPLSEFIDLCLGASFVARGQDGG